MTDITKLRALFARGLVIGLGDEQQTCIEGAIALASGEPLIELESVLPWEELSVALASENREDLFIGGTVDEKAKALVLYRGNLDQVVVPFQEERLKLDK